eukprot:881161_1
MMITANAADLLQKLNGVSWVMMITANAADLLQKLNGVSWVMMITANAGDLLQKLYNFDAVFKTIDESSPEVTEYHCQKFTPILNKLGLNGQFQQALQDKQIHSKSSIIHIQKMTQEEWNVGIMNGLKLGLKLKALYNSTGNIRK